MGVAHSKLNESKYWVRPTEVAVVGPVARERDGVDGRLITIWMESGFYGTGE